MGNRHLGPPDWEELLEEESSENYLEEEDSVVPSTEGADHMLQCWTVELGVTRLAGVRSSPLLKVTTKVNWYICVTDN